MSSAPLLYRSRYVIVALLIAMAVFILFRVRNRERPRSSGPLPHQVYVWQRAWTESVAHSVIERGPTFAAILALAAEVKWNDNRPDVTQINPDYRVLIATAKPVGLVLRIGPYSGSFEDDSSKWLGGLAAATIAKARSNQLSVAELQIDFDCPESKLSGFMEWIKAARRAVPNTRVTITALPSWLDRPAFSDLAALTDGYVLQVHSLKRPQSINQPCALCDVKAALQAVERAGRLNRPFRVALPTYGYWAAFGLDGRCIGISAEGPSLAWPADTRRETIQADPQAIAGLIRSWARDRPRAMTDIIWYRLPLDEDELTWRWPTLVAVRNGVAPHADLQVNLLQSKDGLVEIQLVNRGQADQDSPVQVTLSWQSGRVVATEALEGFDVAGTSNLCWRARSGRGRLGPGEARLIGWARFEDATLLQAKLQ